MFTPSVPNSCLCLMKTTANKAIVDSRLRRQCRILMNSTKHYSCLTSSWYRCGWFWPIGPCIHDVIRKMKPEVHNVSQRRRRRTEPRHRQHARKMVKFGRAVFELCELTDRQTDILITTFHKVSLGEAIHDLRGKFLQQFTLLSTAPICCHYFCGVAQYYGESVCLSVCLSVTISQKRNHTSALHQIFRASCLWPWLGPLLATLQHVTYVLPVLQMTPCFSIMGSKAQTTL